MTEELTYAESQYSHFIIIGLSVLGITWGGINGLMVSSNSC